MKMIGKSTQVCRVGNCRCANAHDSLGRKKERRLAKRREKALQKEKMKNPYHEYTTENWEDY